MQFITTLFNNVKFRNVIFLTPKYTKIIIKYCCCYLIILFQPITYRNVTNYDYRIPFTSVQKINKINKRWSELDLPIRARIIQFQI